MRLRFFIFLSVFGFCSESLFSAETLWEWAPYRISVQIDLAEEAGVLLSPLQQGSGIKQENGIVGEIDRSLKQEVRNWVGGLWEIEVGSGRFPERLRFEPSLPGTALAPHPETIPESWAGFDKIAFVRIEIVSGELRVRAREFDVRTQTVNDGVSQTVYAPQELAGSVFEAIRSGFVPLAKVESVKAKEVILRLRGGELDQGKERTSERPDAAASSDNPAFERVEPGSVFLPLLRSFRRNGELETIQSVPWTALAVESREGSRIVCRLESTLQVPLRNRGRGRTEQLAILPRIQEEPTRLMLQPRNPPPPKKRGKEEPPVEPDTRIAFLPKYVISESIPDIESDVPLGETNASGMFSIPYREGNPIRYFFVKQDGVVLARFLLVQGVFANYPLPIPDDAVRVAAEGALIGIQEEVIDLTARRAILVGRIEKYTAQGDNESLAKAQREIQRLKTREQIVAQLETEKQRHRSPDPLVQRRIEIMFENTKTIINQNMK